MNENDRRVCVCMCVCISAAEDEFQDLCFEFGIELDDVVNESDLLESQGAGAAAMGSTSADEKVADDKVIFRIEVPANRYDLLCTEGIATALRVFLGLEPAPTFTVTPPVVEITASREVLLVRPFVVAAVLRNISFTPATYASFIELQERLHQNLCRRRSLVAIGTHDLDTLEPNFTFEARPPRSIRFAPLKHEAHQVFDAVELFEYYRSNEAGRQLRKYLPIIENAPVYPVVLDANQTVCSLPPIINGAHSAISLDTKNVFIECTATDLTKAHIVLNTICTMFARYCEAPNTVEAVTVRDVTGGVTQTPDLGKRSVEADTKYVQTCIGVDIEPGQMVSLLKRMQLDARLEVGIDEGTSTTIIADVPPTRSDVLHACDVMEDVAIAYGFNNIPKSVPKSATVGREQPLNHFTDLIRTEVAMAGFTEMLTWALQSHADNFDNLNRTAPSSGGANTDTTKSSDDDGPTSFTKDRAVAIGNPKTAEFQECRMSLLAGALKTLGENKKAPLPLKLFEIGDVVVQDAAADVGARNERRLVAVYTNSKGAGFEVVHGILDRVMTMMGVMHESAAGASKPGAAYYYFRPPAKGTHDGAFFPGREAQVVYHKGDRAGDKEEKDIVLGVFGVMHPDVLERYDVVSPTSALEICIEPFVHMQ